MSLFGLHYTDAFPIDVWMKRILAEHYPTGYPYKKYSPYNGICLHLTIVSALLEKVFSLQRDLPAVHVRFFQAYSVNPSTDALNMAKL